MNFREEHHNTQFYNLIEQIVFATVYRALQYALDAK